jgi:hypothetical protein
MTQVIAAVHSGGIALATDSRAIRYDVEGPGRILTVRKLFSLGTHAFVLSAGSGIGLPLSRRLEAFVRHRGISWADRVLRLAGPFLTQHYREVLSSAGDSIHEDPLGRLFFLVGGAPCGGFNNPYKMILLASEGGRLPFEEHEVRHCLTIPRSLGLEIKLHRLCLNQTPLEGIVALAKDFLHRRAQEDEGVGPPFHWAVLTGQGLRMGRWVGEPEAGLNCKGE